MKFLAKILIVFSLLLPLATPVLAYNPLGAACNGNSSAACTQNNNFQTNTKNPVNDVVQSAANIVATAAGVAAVIIIIVSGVTMASSGGDQERVKKARGQLMGAVIGLAIVALAWVIVTFVVQKLVS